MKKYFGGNSNGSVRTSVWSNCCSTYNYIWNQRNGSNRNTGQNNRVVCLTKTVQSIFRATRNITASFSIGLGALEVWSIAAATEREKIKFWEDANDNRRQFGAIISSLLRTDDSSDVLRKCRTGNDIWIMDLLQIRCRKLRPIVRAGLCIRQTCVLVCAKCQFLRLFIDTGNVCCYTYNQGELK